MLTGDSNTNAKNDQLYGFHQLKLDYLSKHYGIKQLSESDWKLLNDKQQLAKLLEIAKEKVIDKNVLENSE